MLKKLADISLHFVYIYGIRYGWQLERGPTKHRALLNVTACKCPVTVSDMPITAREMKSTVVPLLPNIFPAFV